MGLKPSDKRGNKESDNAALHGCEGIIEGRLRGVSSTRGKKSPRVDKQKKWPLFWQSRYAVDGQPSGMAPKRKADDPWNLESG